MKVAICISGFLRTWKTCRDSFVSQFMRDLEFDPDIFVHTYNQNCYSVSSASSQANEYYTTEEIQKMFENLPIKNIAVEDLTKIDLTRGRKFSRLYGYGKQVPFSADPSSPKVYIGDKICERFRKIEACNDLRIEYEKTTGTTYDFVVTTRFDVLYMDTPDWKTMFDHLFHTELGASEKLPHEMCIIASPETTDKTVGKMLTHLSDPEYKPAALTINDVLDISLKKHGLKVGSYWGFALTCRRPGTVKSPPLFRVPHRGDVPIEEAISVMRKRHLVNIPTPKLRYYEFLQ